MKCSNNNPDMSGMLTKVWGPSLWETIHCLAFNYPLQPSDTEKTNYKNFFYNLPNILPCVECRKSCHKFITSGETLLTESVFNNKKTLTEWVFKLHNAVNNKLGVTYDFTYEMFREKYESYIAICKLDPQEKIPVYQNYYNKEGPFLSYELALCFEQHAINMGLLDYRKNLDYIKSVYPNKKSNEWIQRNKTVWNTIQYMRLNAITGIDKDENSKNYGLPVVEELKLFQNMSTSLSINEINKALQNLGFEYKKVYHFTK